MKKLIIIAGLPGVGKSYTARFLQSKLENVKYFDSDLFAKEYGEKHKVDFVNLSKEEQKKWRLTFHAAKIVEIEKLFDKFDYILLDTCFDMPESRELFYNFAKEKDVSLVVLKIVCPEDIVKKRIFENRHEEERMVGDKEGRWKVHQLFKDRWTPIPKIDFEIDSSKDVEEQVEEFIKLVI